MSVFDTIPDRPEMMLQHDTPTPVTFNANEPESTIKDKYDADKYEFFVNGDSIFGISSKPLMRALKPFTPLKDKTLVITKSGRGYDTSYVVEEVTE